MTRKTSSAFTLIELLVAVGIIAILVTIVFMMMPAIKDRARRTASLNNMRQIGTAFHLYAGDNDYRLPGRVSGGAGSSDKWPRLLLEYLGNDPKVYAEPGDPNNYLFKKTDPLSNSPNNTSYIMNGYNDLGTMEDESVIIKISRMDQPSQTILLGCQSGTNHFYMDFEEGNHNKILNTKLYGDGSNYLFADGSAKFLKEKDYEKMGGHELWLVSRPSDYQIP